jgi:hypothetical protein
MHYKNTIEAIYVNLEELQDLLRKFSHTETLSNIDIDLALSKLRYSYDMLLLIRKDINITSESPEQVKKDIRADYEQQSEQEESESGKGDQKPPEAVPSEDKKPSRVETIQDKYKSPTGSINEKMAQKYQDISARIKANPISSIRNAIGINEKFHFINDLFDGDKQLYDNTLTILDNSTNFNEAYNYLIENFTWDMDDETVQQLLELIRRKYIKQKDEE